MNHTSRLLRHLKIKDLQKFGYRDREEVGLFLDGELDRVNPWTVNLEQEDGLYKSGNILTALQGRSMTKILEKEYGVSPLDRYTICKAVSLSIIPKHRMFVFRTDISSFYESIDTTSLVTTIRNNHELEYRCVEMIVEVLSEAEGLPRGWSPSSVLSEIHLKSFDDKIYRDPRIITAFRYVDDILLIGHGNPEEEDIFKLVQGCLPKPLRLSEKKTKLSLLGYGGKSSFDYLGYRFSTSKCESCRIGRSDLFRVEISIAPGKVKRLKSKVGVAFRNFVKGGSADMLIHNIRTLAQSVQLSDELRLRRGLIHSYDLATCPCSLIEVDSLIYYFISNKIKSFPLEIQAKLSLLQKKKLRKLSFYRSFKSKTRYGD